MGYQITEFIGYTISLTVGERWIQIMSLLRAEAQEQTLPLELVLVKLELKSFRGVVWSSLRDRVLEETLHLTKLYLQGPHYVFKIYVRKKSPCGFGRGWVELGSDHFEISLQYSILLEKGLYSKETILCISTNGYT